MKKITIVLAEDHAMIREGLRRVLALENDFQVIGEAKDGREAVRLARALGPAVVVMDLAMPLLNGCEAARQLVEKMPRIRVLILSAHGEKIYVRRAMSAGVAGYVLKQNCLRDLFLAIRTVSSGASYFMAELSAQAMPGRPASTVHKANEQNNKVELTARESEVLQLIAEGMPNKRTAGELGISIKTVEKHRGRIMYKLGIHDTAGLTRYAIGAGILPPPFI